MANPKSKSIPVLCIYNVKPEKADEFRRVLAKHQPAMQKAGLVGPEPVQYWTGHAHRGNKQCFVELMYWKDETSASRAHESPDVMAVWEPLGKLCQDDMEFIDLKSFSF